MNVLIVVVTAGDAASVTGVDAMVVSFVGPGDIDVAMIPADA